MTRRSRPYLQSSADDLRQLFGSYPFDAAVLSDLAYELAHRSRRSAKDLEKKVRQQLSLLTNAQRKVRPSNATSKPMPLMTRSGQRTLRSHPAGTKGRHHSAMPTPTSARTTNSIPSLTAEQAHVVEQPWTSKLLVVAGPGTGKTHTVSFRVLNLVDRQGLRPGDELLVLSFSRAAVAEMGRRLKHVGGAAHYARVVTFDSFASQLLAQVEPEGTWRNTSYDERIGRATAELLSRKAAVTDRIAPVRHVIIDEMQDVVGLRAQFVQAILQSVSGGFTVLGDPAQGIYTFQLPESDREIGGHALNLWLRETFGKELAVAHLTRNHRAHNEHASLALRFGAVLNADHPDYPAIYKKIRSTVQMLPNVGEASIALSKASPVSRAVLCRNNGQALLLSKALFSEAIQHRYQRRATDKVIPRWVADLARLAPSRVCTRSQIESLIDNLSYDHPPPDVAWNLLKLVERGAALKTLDFSKLEANLFGGLFPDELIDAGGAPLVISTVHRAKGLEFQHVFMFDNELWDESSPAAIAEETRITYVALTRARERLWKIQPPDTRRLRREDRRDGRWYERAWSDEWKTSAFEVQGDDVDATAPVAQDYLSTSVERGSSVTLALADDYLERCEGASGSYHVLHNSNVIGRTSAEFIFAFNRVLRRKVPTTRWPRVIDGLYIDCIESVCGKPGRPASGLVVNVWLRPRLFGMGTLKWRQ